MFKLYEEGRGADLSPGTIDDAGHLPDPPESTGGLHAEGHRLDSGEHDLRDLL